MAERAGWLPAAEPISVWQSRTCSPSAAAPVHSALRRAGVVWLAARDQTASRLDSGVTVTSPLLAEGTRLPELWLRPGRLVILCELQPHQVWRFKGAMSAQAEPLLIAARLPSFRRAAAACEAQRVGAADLVLMRAWTTHGPRWLFSPSALELDRAVAGAVGLDVGAVPHLALWRRHFLFAPDLEPSRGLGLSLPSAHVAAPASRVAALLGMLADVRADTARGWVNRHRVPRFVRQRLTRSVG